MLISAIILTIIFLSILLFFIIRNKNIKQSTYSNNLLEQNKFILKAEEKILIQDYFKILDLYLEGFFLRKYILSLITIRLSKINELKDKYEDINCTRVRFPLLYSDISDKKSSLVSFLKEEYKNDILSNELDAYKLIDEIKESKKKKKHFEILNELKKHISNDDVENWEKLLNLEPVAIVN